MISVHRILIALSSVVHIEYLLVRQVIILHDNYLLLLIEILTRRLFTQFLIVLPML
jgi:hypothetical protein